MRLKGRHLPMSSSRTVSVVIRLPKYSLIGSEIREELKPESLSFTTIAKKVGERWQDIPAEEKEPYESEASAAKEKYHAEMADYKTTRSYRDYQQYLAEFKAKHASNSGTYRLCSIISLNLTHDEMENGQSSRQKKPRRAQLVVGVY